MEQERRNGGVDVDVPNVEQHARLVSALDEFVSAGMRLVEAWDDETFHADTAAPLPARLTPPLSLDEWLDELREHYRERLTPRVVNGETWYPWPERGAWYTAAGDKMGELYAPMLTGGGFDPDDIGEIEIAWEDA